MPIRVMPICTVDRKRPGSLASASAVAAPRRPFAAIAARHGNHKTAAGEVRAADKHSGRLAVDGNLQHGVVDIVVAIAHRILDDVGTLGVEHQFHAGTIRIACLELGRIGIFSVELAFS